jgi:hypothetical protein
MADLDKLRDLADAYCSGEELQRVLLESILERFIVLADEKLTSVAAAVLDRGEMMNHQQKMMAAMFHEQADELMSHIKKLVTPDCRLTLIVRKPGNVEADIVLTDDQLPEAIKVLQRRSTGDAADDAARRWYEAAAPYATPEALKEALQRFTAAKIMTERQTDAGYEALSRQALHWEAKWRESEAEANKLRGLLERECRDADKIAAALGVGRTEGGSLMVARMMNHVSDLEANIHALEDAITSELPSGISELVFEKRASMLRPEQLISTK